MAKQLARHQSPSFELLRPYQQHSPPQWINLSRQFIASGFRFESPQPPAAQKYQEVVPNCVVPLLDQYTLTKPFMQTAGVAKGKPFHSPNKQLASPVAVRKCSVIPPHPANPQWEMPPEKGAQKCREGTNPTQPKKVKSIGAWCAKCPKNAEQNEETCFVSLAPHGSHRLLASPPRSRKGTCGPQGRWLSVSSFSWEIENSGEIGVGWLQSTYQKYILRTSQRLHARFLQYKKNAANKKTTSHLHLSRTVLGFFPLEYDTQPCSKHWLIRIH